jgi:hypothetical protein
MAQTVWGGPATAERATALMSKAEVVVMVVMVVMRARKPVVTQTIEDVPLLHKVPRVVTLRLTSVRGKNVTTEMDYLETVVPEPAR